jgi:hypothetical protein
MAAPVIYRSSDTNAPVLFGGGGSLISLLDAILVNGYGSAFAQATLSSASGALVANGDTVTVDGVTYTFSTGTMTGAPVNTIRAITSAGQNFLDLQHAINGTGSPGSHYSSLGVTPQPNVWAATVVAGPPATLLIQARRGGSAGNAIAVGKSAASLALTGAALTGGGGSDSKASAGWTKPYGTFPQGVYRQPAGSRFHLQVDDSGPGVGQARDARSFGFEAMTAYNVGSGQFPTVAQIAAGAVIRKSSTLDNTARSWVAFADDRTFYLVTLSGDVALNYHGFSFGDFYSLITGDAYKCLIMGGSSEASGANSSSAFGSIQNIGTGLSQVGHWLPRNYSGFGGSTVFVKTSDYALTALSNYMAGTIGFPNSDGGVYLAPLRIAEGSNPGVTISGAVYLRGRLRGLYMICHPVTSFADGDVIAGSGAYAGRTFQVVKFLHSASTSVAFAAIETTPWAVSA